MNSFEHPQGGSPQGAKPYSQAPGPEEAGLAPQLREHLGAVEAPAYLWNRIQDANRQPAPAPAARRWQPALAAAAAVIVLMGGYVALQLTDPATTVEARAVESLTKNPTKLGLLSSDPVEIRRWLRTEAGVDVPLPPEHSGMVEIIGANVVPGTLTQAPMAEIAYRVGEYNASLIVANDPGAARSYPDHEARPSNAAENARVSSWNMQGQNYALAWAAPGEFRVACLLCHGGTEPLLMN